MNFSWLAILTCILHALGITSDHKVSRLNVVRKLTSNVNFQSDVITLVLVYKFAKLCCVSDNHVFCADLNRQLKVVILQMFVAHYGLLSHLL